jgi:prophage regulatory protein
MCLDNLRRGEIFMTTIEEQALKILRLDKVREKTGLSRSTIYDRMGKGTFPGSISLGARAVGWLENEVNDWLTLCIENRFNYTDLNRVGGQI